MSWAEIYKKNIIKYGGDVAFVNKKSIEKKVLLNFVTKYAAKKDMILESGCGSGATSIFLASKGYNVQAIDADTEMLALGKNMSLHFKKRPIFKRMNILETSYKSNSFKVTFSQGVLEHFKNDDIKKIINEQLRISEYMIFSVPSSYFTKKDRIYGNERFMNVAQWQKIIARSNGKIIDTFGFYYDGLLRKLAIYFPRLLINHAPYIGFVLVSKKMR